MKTTYKISLAIITCILLAYTSADAQEFKTDKSITQQLEQGTVPGLKFGPVTVTAQKSQNVNEGKERKYSSRDIEEVLFTGFSKKSPSTLRTTLTAKSANSVAGTIKLASDSEAKKPDDKDKKVAIPKLPPMQDQTDVKKKE